MKRSGRWLVALALVLLPGGAYAAWLLRRDVPASAYRTAPIRRADIVATIAATGTIVPEDVVDVGAQVNGQVAAFGEGEDGKPIDFCSAVSEGMVLARIDDSLYAADVATAEAQRGEAQAQIGVAQANLEQSQARLEQADADWKRAQVLEKSPALSPADYDSARSAFRQAQASVAVSGAALEQGRAALASSEASLQRAKWNLTYCTIRSPVEGVILDRRVEIGQTVVASFNAPSLFLIAKDLRRMKVLVQVNEADIAHVRPGAGVSFTADARPGATFRGVVRKVRLNAALTQNVVTYTVEISTDNSDLSLLPYLTANVSFEVSRSEQVLAVPNAALRWSPRGAPEARAASAEPVVWLLGDGRPRPLAVHVGTSDGSLTAVEADGAVEGAQVVVGDAPAAARASDAQNPFTPQLRSGRSGR